MVIVGGVFARLGQFIAWLVPQQCGYVCCPYVMEGLGEPGFSRACYEVIVPEP